MSSPKTLTLVCSVRLHNSTLPLPGPGEERAVVDRDRVSGEAGVISLSTVIVLPAFMYI